MLSVFDIFRVGLGPSSSHTVGPMRAALRFAQALQSAAQLGQVARVEAVLYGSLGATGRGHASDHGVVLGLLGEEPHSVLPHAAQALLDAVQRDRQLLLLGRHRIGFDPARDIQLQPDQSQPEHPNALRLRAFDAAGAELAQAHYFSVGGGSIVARGESAGAQPAGAPAPFPFGSCAELIAHTAAQRCSVARIVLANECAWRTEDGVRQGLLQVWQVMQDCVQRGFGVGNPQAERPLPGALRMRRRAPALYRSLRARGDADPLAAMDWVNAFAMAVNEENAAGGRVVTAPTNGAAGIVPAVLHYYMAFVPGAHAGGVADFLLTAAAIGMLYKANASISGAEVGCQGEVGVACSMAAAALAAVQGGTPQQVENAAEIGMEHNLGLTCDPVGGLVQIPCVERNAMGAVKAINAARMALLGDGTHHVSLDAVIRTMLQTGADMKSTYKETSLAGLAVNVVEC
ncbi:L-serine ammonia-lyase [Pseudorhodoferax sp.]|uniref:L-serine ammonia-lyase n=1 Tax=Pseudorhodoferax sp. TaxID=1993553 RepID=UPI002DD68971|nr:L-serine ammonia-lyase [Pseudorhodoferax sp.]